MPFNLLKKYPALLEFSYDSFEKNIKSIRKVFDRDFIETTQSFNNKKIHPIPLEDNKDSIDLLFKHLTYKKNNKTKERDEFDRDRTIRIHWIKHHTQNKEEQNILVFSTKERHRTYRTYIYNTIHNYVIVLEPLRCNDAYYLCSAYVLQGKDYERDKIMRKYKRYKLDIIL